MNFLLSCVGKFERENYKKRKRQSYKKTMMTRSFVCGHFSVVCFRLIVKDVIRAYVYFLSVLNPFLKFFLIMEM